MPCDVTSGESVEAAFKAIEEQYGPVEVLVSNAGVTNDGLLLRMSEDDFSSVIDANLTAAYRVAKRATQGMLRARKGRMIFMSSVVALARLGRSGQLRRVEGGPRRAWPARWPGSWRRAGSPSTSSRRARSRRT